MDQTDLSGLYSGIGGASTLEGLYNLLSGSSSTSGVTNQASGNANQYGGQLNQLLTNPGSFALSPAAQTQLDTGTQNLQRSAAAQGFAGSGNTLAELQQYGQGVASQDYNTQVNTLGALMQGQQSTALNAANQQQQQRSSALGALGGGLGMLGSSGGLSSLMSMLGQGGSSLMNLFGSGAATNTDFGSALGLGSGSYFGANADAATNVGSSMADQAGSFSYTGDAASSSDSLANMFSGWGS